MQYTLMFIFFQGAYMRRHITTLHPDKELILRLQDGFYYVPPDTVELKAYPLKRSTPTPPPMSIEESEKGAKAKIEEKIEVLTYLNLCELKCEFNYLYKVMFIFILGEI